jgi:hypothetical protein
MAALPGEPSSMRIITENFQKFTRFDGQDCNVDQHLRSGLEDDKQDPDRAGHPIKLKTIIQFGCIVHRADWVWESSDVVNAL